MSKSNKMPAEENTGKMPAQDTGTSKSNTIEQKRVPPPPGAVQQNEVYVETAVASTDSVKLERAKSERKAKPTEYKSRRRLPKNDVGYGFMKVIGVVLPLVYFLASMASMALIYMLHAPVYVALIVSAGEIALSWALFNGKSVLGGHGRGCNRVTAVIMCAVGIGLLVCLIVNLDGLFPKLVQIKQMVEEGNASQSFYDAEVKEIRMAMIISFIALAVVMVGCSIFGDRGIPRSSTALATVGGASSVLLILNFLIEMPKNASSVYDPSFFIETLIGAVLISIPCGAFIALTCVIGYKVSD